MANFRIVPFAACLAVSGLLSAQDGKPVAASAEKQASAQKQDGAPVKVAVAPVVAVVDFAKVLDVYPKAVAERERLNALRKSFNDQMDALTKRIEELKLQVPLYPEGSREQAMKQLDLETLMQQRPALAKLLNEQLQIEEMRKDVALYEDVDIAVAKVAKDRGVHIVLRKMSDLPERTDDAGIKEIRDRVVAYDRRQVWYVAPEVDLTPHVIKFMQVPIERPKASADGGKGAGGGNKDGGAPQGNGGL
ncbi:MAG: OmpH family outer membrane protein [Planctomycetes bacterium]|nr:OmpH family outer membrane protein [Planctomycetota bacterium]